MSTRRPSHPHAFHSMLALAAMLAIGIFTVIGATGSYAKPIDLNTNNNAQYDPTSLNFHLFDLRQFRARHRARLRELPVPAPAQESLSSSSESVTSSSDASASSAATHDAAVEPLTLDQLSTTERAVLNQQLRMHVCPFGALPAYQALCELMLRAQPRRALMQGLRNPNQ